MHLEILNENQRDLLPFLSKFKREFYMVGGTAIALHIGHRLSIDFDLFKNGIIHSKRITTKFNENKKAFKVTLNRDGQLNLVCRDVTFTFFNFEYNVPHPLSVEKSITIPSLLDLAAMKAFALGRRSKWKDYIDLFFILRDYYSLSQICAQANLRFGELFSEKLFRGQLNYFKGISFEEQVEFMPGFEVSEEEVKQFLIDAALTGF
jgi:Nucleotidyl transferase AbiEii toxin, Type IV TA system